MDTDPARREARLIVLRRSPERLEALKRAMAQFLGGVLSIRDAGVRTENGLVEPTLSPHKIVRRPSLAKLFLDRGGYLPSVQMLRDEYETQQLLNTIQSVRRIEFRLAHRSPDGVHVLLAPYTKHHCFQKSFALPRGDGEVSTIGGTCHRLAQHVDADIRQWLEVVARRLERDGVPPSAPEELARVVAKVATTIARRITLAESPEAPDTDELVAAALRDFSGEGGEGDEVPDNRCVDCLGVAIDLAQVGSSAFVHDNATAVRRSITKVVHSMSPTVGFVGMNADRANLDRLLAAVHVHGPGMWTEVDAWQQAHGSFASLAFLNVLFLLTNGNELDPSRHVLRRATADEGADDGAGVAAPLRLPRPEFCAPFSDFVFDRERIGDRTTTRVLTLVVAQLLYTPGAFERGVVSRRVAFDTYIDALSESAPAVGHTRTATEHLRMGFPLRELLQQVLDRASHNYPEVLKSMCALSHFSMQEMYDVFDEQSPMLEEIGGELQDLTGRALTCALPRNQHGAVYRGFAFDGLRYGLPLLFNERRACGVSPLQPTRAFCDLVKTISNHCVSMPGELWISTRAAGKAPPALLHLLNALVAAGVIVQSRPWTGPRGQRVRHGAEVYQLPWSVVHQLQ